MSESTLEWNFGEFSFANHRLKSFRTAFAYGVSFFLFMMLVRKGWESGLIVGVFASVIIYLRMLSDGRTYISKIHISNGSLEMKYFDHGEKRELHCAMTDVKVAKKFRLIRARSPYLKINCSSDSVAIKQFETHEWNETKMDELISVLGR